MISEQLNRGLSEDESSTRYPEALIISGFQILWPSMLCGDRDKGLDFDKYDRLDRLDRQTDECGFSIYYVDLTNATVSISNYEAENVKSARCLGPHLKQKRWLFEELLSLFSELEKR